MTPPLRTYVLAILALLLAPGPAGGPKPPSPSGLSVAERVVDAYVSNRARAREAYAARYGISSELAGLIRREAERAGLDPELAFRVVRVESSFDQRAVSRAGAIGLAQVLPSTGAWVEPGTTRVQLFEPERNLRIGFTYLTILLRRFGNVRLALLAYNRGPNRVAEIVRGGGDPANGYARRVLE